MTDFNIEINPQPSFLLEITSTSGNSATTVETIVTGGNIVEVSNRDKILPSDFPDTYPISWTTGSLPISRIENFASGVSGLLPITEIYGNSGILVSTSGTKYYISVTGEFGLSTQQVLEVLLSGIAVNITGGSGNFNYLTVNNIPVSISGHTHISNDILNFGSAVSGLIPVKSISGGYGISVTGASGNYVISSALTSVDEANSLVTVVFNESATPIPKFTAIFISGGHGDLPVAALAIANGELRSSKTYGITQEVIPAMSSGHVVSYGNIYGLDTDQFNPSAPQGNIDGQVMYLSPTVSGGLTLTKPYAPNHLVAVGTVIRTHKNEGVFNVRIQNGFEMEELHNVASTGAISGQFLKYDGSLWRNSGILSSDISDFASAVSGISPNISITGTSGIAVNKAGNTYTIYTTGNFGLTSSQVQSLLNSGVSIYVTGGSGNFSSLTINGTPVSVSGHTHALNEVSNNVLYQSGTNIGLRTSTPRSALDIKGDLLVSDGAGFFGNFTPSGGIPSNQYIGHNIQDINGNPTLVNSAYPSWVTRLGGSSVGGDNFNIVRIPASGSWGSQQSLFYISNSGNIGIGTTSPSTRLHVNGNITALTGLFTSLLVNNTGVSLSGHAHTASNITDFNSATSGLLIPYALLTSGNFTNLYITGIPVSVSGHTHVSSQITNFNSSVSGLLPSISGSGYAAVNLLNNVYIVSISGLQPSGNYSLVGHTHTASNITDFNASVSGLLTPYALLNSPNFSGVPTAPTAASGTNTTQLATTQFVRTEVANLVASAPSTLDTLNELAAALGNDPNFATTVTNSLSTKIAGTGTSNYLPRFSGSQSLINSNIYNDASGVGIGTNSPQDFLHIEGDVTLGNSAGSKTAWNRAFYVFRDPASSNSYGITLGGESGNNRWHTSIFAPEYSDIAFRFDPLNNNEKTNGQNSFTTRMIVRGDSGYVGIGTVNPTSRLDVSGNITASGGSFSSLTVNSLPVSVSGHTHISSQITDFNSGVSGLLPVTNIIGTSGASVTSSGTVFTVAVTGTFGLTNSEIQNLLNSGVNIYITGGSGSLSSLNVSGYPVVLANGTTNYHPKFSGQTLINSFAYENATGIGIKTVNPVVPLHVYGTLLVDGLGQSANSYSEGIRLGAGSNGYSIVTFGANPAFPSGSQSGQWWIGRHGGTSGFNINHNGTDIFHAITGGNIGIGTIAPTQRLDVRGNAFVSGVLTSPSGYFGVGLTTPAAKLHAYSSVSGDNVFFVEGTNGSLFSVVDNLSGSLMSVNNNAGLPIFEVFSDDRVIAGRFNKNDFVVSSGGNVGVGTASPAYKLQVSGSFGATTKSFNISHPSKPGYRLEYGSLESPYHGVRLTGRDRVVNGRCIVKLPEYVKDLVHEDGINIQITNINHYKTLCIKKIDLAKNSFEVSSSWCDFRDREFFWTFTAQRKDVDKLEVERKEI